MVKATLTLVIALIASVIGTPIQTKVKRRSVSNRILRTLHEPLLGSNRVRTVIANYPSIIPKSSQVKLISNIYASSYQDRMKKIKILSKFVNRSRFCLFPTRTEIWLRVDIFAEVFGVIVSICWVGASNTAGQSYDRWKFTANHTTWSIWTVYTIDNSWRAKSSARPSWWCLYFWNLPNH